MCEMYQKSSTLHCGSIKWGWGCCCTATIDPGSSKAIEAIRYGILDEGLSGGEGTLTSTKILMERLLSTLCIHTWFQETPNYQNTFPMYTESVPPLPDIPRIQIKTAVDRKYFDHRFSDSLGRIIQPPKVEILFQFLVLDYPQPRNSDSLYSLMSFSLVLCAGYPIV